MYIDCKSELYPQGLDHKSTYMYIMLYMSDPHYNEHSYSPT